jgi:two-component system sensor histidine kinase RegB
VTTMGRALRRHQRMLADAREQSLRDEQLVALGTLAASTAHELGTPLATMTLTAEELRDELGDPPGQVVEQLDLLKSQIGRCKEALSVLSASAGNLRATGGGAMSLDRYFASLLEDWLRSRPGVKLESRIEGSDPAPRVVAERTLSQALTNIIDNAADVSRHLERRVGKSPLSSQGSGAGLGLGLFLSHGIIERLGGRVTLGERSGGGLETRVDLPLKALGVAG